MPYHAALLTHTLVELGIFVVATGVALRLTGALSHFPAVLGTIAPLLLLTPIGLAYLERGQFDLYVGACYLLVFTYLFTPRLSLVLVAGVLAAVKWTALPWLGALALFVLVVGPRGSRRLWLFAAPLIALASFLLLPDTRFIEDLRYWEQSMRPQGVSFAHLASIAHLTSIAHLASIAHLVPPRIGKILPILTVLFVAGVLRWRRRQPERDAALQATAAPLGLALAIQAAAFGTVSFEYRAVSLLGLVPALAIWVERAEGVSTVLKAATFAGFGLFLVVAFRLHNLTGGLRLDMMVLTYLAASMGFTALAAILAWRRPDPAAATSAAA